LSASRPEFPLADLLLGLSILLLQLHCRFCLPFHPERLRRYYWPILAENHLTRRLFGSTVRRIEALPESRGDGKVERNGFNGGG
jgi:hypothetical protein